jgi:hypothetical protein
MNKIDEMLEYVSEMTDKDLLYPTDLKEAIIGYSESFGGEVTLLLDKKKCIDIFIGEGMTHEEAIEHFDYNVIGGYVEGVPSYAVLLDDLYNV